jgi:HIV Tat-specific factor 1
MFSLQELEEDTSLLLDLKEDVRDECSALGEVTNVVLYDVCRCFSLTHSHVSSAL